MLPQFIMLLFMVKMIISAYKKNQEKQTPLSEKELYNLIIGLVAFNLLLWWGGFYHAL
jgi:hypothetical protein